MILLEVPDFEIHSYLLFEKVCGGIFNFSFSNYHPVGLAKREFC